MAPDFSKVKIYYNPQIEGGKEFAQKTAEKFNNAHYDSTENLSNLKSDVSLVVSIGGDGTILKCAKYASEKDIPVIGFNLGRLGFLAQANKDELDCVIEKLQNQEYRIEERQMLETNIGNKKITALNDIVIKGEVYSRTSALNLYINNELVSNYLADGLIISTPTGSTAYTLSAGGPVVAPDIDCFIIVPICPHTLSARPLVIKNTEDIKITMCDCKKFQVTSDGQTEFEMNGELNIKKSEKHAKLVLLNNENNNFYQVLRQKLHWGQKPEKC